MVPPVRTGPGIEGRGAMTEPRQSMWGPRYDGELITVKPDIMLQSAAFETFGEAFVSIGEPPPYAWAGRKETT